MDSITNNSLANLSEERGWEYKQVTVTRVPGYGFGIAVSGGRDNPHFASGDPSIAVSDVLASGPAERLLHVNDRILSVNGISLQNVDYTTAVQVLRDSGDTVVLFIKRRIANHQHSLSLGSGLPLMSLGANSFPLKVTLTKNSKKEDFGIVLGCKLFVKEISSKAREQLLNSNQMLHEGDFLTKLNNTSCNDMSIKEAKKLIDSSKDKLHLTVTRDSNATQNVSHQTQSSISTTGAVNNFYKDDFLTSPQTYSNQNLYVQPPTRNSNLNPNGINEEKLDINSGSNTLGDDKSNLAPKGRLRQPFSEGNIINQLHANSAENFERGKVREEPPRPPPPRPEDYFTTKRQLYEDDPLIQKSKQLTPDARYITFLKEGSVGIRLTGGNFVGIFVTAVQPGSPASLQGLQPGDKILKVNDMDMTGVTREEAVLFLLGLQDRIELIVQYCKEEYDNVVASQKGDSFYIKTHFHYENSAKGEMTFRSGDIFHVIDTLYNGVVGSWQVYQIGRSNQQGQKGIIPNKARAEELATAQFNATKKEMSSNESRGSFFRRRRNSNRRSKSLGKEHWDDILFSDTVSKFPAYERVVLKHPGFARPVILFGPIADVARDKLFKDFPDKFISPQMDNNMEDFKHQKSSPIIIRLSAIREVISTGKHALLDITPNAVERLNYAQLYPIVIFLKADSKITIKQMRQGLSKSAHKSSKKLLEQCQKLDKVWAHIFCSIILLNDNADNWYRKVREVIDKQQSGAIWMSESKPEESLSDDFLFPMSSLRLSYASSPESDLEHSPGPPLSSNLGTNGNTGRLTKASSDPSVVLPDNSTADILPPYQPSFTSRYGFANQQLTDNQPSNPSNMNQNSNQEMARIMDAQIHYKQSGLYNHSSDYPKDRSEYLKEFDYAKEREYLKDPRNDLQNDYSKDLRNDYMKDTRNEYIKDLQNDYMKTSESHKRQNSNIQAHFNYSKGNGLSKQSPTRSPKEERLYCAAPDLPPRIDRAVKPLSLVSTPTKAAHGRSAHERLFGIKAPQSNDNSEQNNNGENPNSHKIGSLERSVNSKSDSLSSYDSLKQNQSVGNSGIGPNAHDDLKTTLSKMDVENPTTPPKYGTRWDQNNRRNERVGLKLELKYPTGPNNPHAEVINESPRNSREVDKEPLEYLNPRTPTERDRQDVYRSPNKQNILNKTYMESKTDYGKYSRNNTAVLDYARNSYQDLSQSHLTVHNMPPHHHSPAKSYHHSNGLDNPQNGPPNSYKPIPPPKPKNYKPPYKGNYNSGEGMIQPLLPYQHGKSHSNPVDQRSPTMNTKQEFYYNMPQNNINNWHPGTAHAPYEVAPPYDHRHANISYASRSEIAPIARANYNVEGGDILEGRLPERSNIVDLQSSREQRGSAFELYRKPMHYNVR